MVTTRPEAIHLMQIVLRYIKKKDALKMLKDMDFEIANNTDNASLRNSIKLVLKYLSWKKYSLIECGKRIIKWNVKSCLGCSNEGLNPQKLIAEIIGVDCISPTILIDGLEWSTCMEWKIKNK